MALLASIKPEQRFKLREYPPQPEMFCLPEEVFGDIPNRQEKGLYRVILRLMGVPIQLPVVKRNILKACRLSSTAPFGVSVALDKLLMAFAAPGAAQRAINRDYERMRSVERIKDVIRSRDSEENTALEQSLYTDLRGQEDILSDIANDPQELINIRAMATRLFIAQIFSLKAREYRLEALADQLSHHESPLIRLGALLGFSDSRKFERVREYLSDRHPVVVDQAQEILEDA